MTDEERDVDVLNGKTRIWRFTAEEQGGSSDTADRLLWLGILRAEHELAASLFGGLCDGTGEPPRGTPSPCRFLKELQFRLLHLGSSAGAQHGHRRGVRPCAFHRPEDHAQRSRRTAHTCRPLRRTPRGPARADLRLRGFRHSAAGIRRVQSIPFSHFAIADSDRRKAAASIAAVLCYNIAVLSGRRKPIPIDKTKRCKAIVSRNVGSFRWRYCCRGKRDHSRASLRIPS